MAGELPAPGTLEKWMLDVERQLRDLATGNALNQGAVQKATGEYVPLSGLAFGQVPARDATQLSLTVNTATWQLGTPTLDVFVSGGRLRVDVAGWLIVGGVNLRMAMSYQVNGPSPAGQADGGGPVVSAPDVSRALAIKSAGNAASYELAAGFPDLVEGLTRGWYRVRGAYQLVGEANAPADTFGYAINRRIFASPL
jgi:hypothetical protein